MAEHRLRKERGVMPEQCVVLSKAELPWVTWQLICVKFNLDPLKVNDLILYVHRAEKLERR